MYGHIADYAVSQIPEGIAISHQVSLASIDATDKRTALYICKTSRCSYVLAIYIVHGS